MTDAAALPDGPKGTSLLPPAMTEADWAKAPVLKSLDQLIIEDLTDEEFDAFLEAALS
ncbi:MAG: hypothetical protein ACR2HR_07220 [Euzebya sp.]